MLTLEDIALLDTTEVRLLIEQNLERAPNIVALDKRIPHAALIATQIKYLQRARKKLPTYYRARAILPPLAFEQSSSEATARHKSWHGETCIDLTCGLGVDTLALSRNFKQIITLEQNPILAEVARINFARMGAENISVINEDATQYTMQLAVKVGRVDMIYADPDRRSSDGRKLVRLEECTPNIPNLLPTLHTISPRIAVKLSPLFDVDEAFRIFGDGTTVEVISMGGECKEVLTYWETGSTNQTITASVIGLESVSYPFRSDEIHTTKPFTPPYKYLIIPDVALRKARITKRYAAEHLPEAFTSPNDGYVFTNQLSENNNFQTIHGKVFEVIYFNRFDPSRMKKELKERGVKNIEIYTHDFPHNAPEIAKKLGIKEGSTEKAAFTRINGNLWVIGLKEIILS